MDLKKERKKERKKEWMKEIVSTDRINKIK